MTPKPFKTVDCPACGKVLRMGRSAVQHLRDAHKITGMDAHQIAHPNDRRAAVIPTARRAAPSTTRPKPDAWDDFDVIDHTDDL